MASGPAPDARYNRAMPYSLVIFDLDGTLADSLPWFRRNVNDVADLFGFSRIADDDVQSLRHAGLPRDPRQAAESPAVEAARHFASHAADEG